MRKRLIGESAPKRAASAGASGPKQRLIFSKETVIKVSQN
ncbi:hypothetical protein GCWU000341_01503 [Oribacterium sp. oral taxon 078 str. F0262]|nr:hypothetical protein GCWU000341_01503 [Oribacterium sp. oral taxon 078 str. F0262]